jgi:anti-sigma-K factor RskA
VRQLPPDVEGDGDGGGRGDPDRPRDPGDLLPGNGNGNGHGRAPMPLPGRDRPSRRPSPAWIAAAAAAVLLAVAAALGALSVNLDTEVDQLRAQSGQVSKVLTASDARTVSAAVGAGGRGSVVFSEQVDSAVFAAAGLSAPPTGRTYQLWYVGSEGARSAGIFEPDDGGRVTQVLEGDLGEAQAVAFTVEPAGGSEQPTSPPLLALELPG